MNIKSQLVQVGAVMDIIGNNPALYLRSFRPRRIWAEKARKNACGTLAFYNTGQHLFIDPYRLRADAFHCFPWQLIQFREFGEPKYILASERKVANILDDVIAFQHCGHNTNSLVEIRLGGRIENGTHRYQARLIIPPLHILYVSTKYAWVRDTLLVRQPLPIRLFQNHYPGLTAVRPQYLVAK